MHYDKEQRVIARIPMVDIDWEMTPFQKHTVEDVRLGPFKGPRNLAYPVATGFVMQGDTHGWASDGRSRRSNPFVPNFELVLNQA